MLWRRGTSPPSSTSARGGLQRGTPATRRCHPNVQHLGCAPCCERSYLSARLGPSGAWAARAQQRTSACPPVKRRCECEREGKWRKERREQVELRLRADPEQRAEVAANGRVRIEGRRVRRGAVGQRRGAQLLLRARLRLCDGTSADTRRIRGAAGLRVAWTLSGSSVSVGTRFVS